MRKKVNLDCGTCQLRRACPNKYSDLRLPRREGGLGYCPKLFTYQLNCWDCIFRDSARQGNDHVYVCRAMSNCRLAVDGSIPDRKPKECPLLSAKRKGL